MRLSDAVDRVIELAGKVRDYYESELPKWHPNYPLVGPDEESAPPPPEETALRDFLGTLPKDTIYQLMLVMYLGRGDFGTEDLAGHYESLKDDYESVKPPFDALELAVSELMRAASLADYLSYGLEEFRKHKINVDKMPLTKAKTRKR